MDKIAKLLHTNPCTMVCNDFIYDRRLSWKAKGIIVTAMSLEDGKFNMPLLTQGMSKDGRDSTYSGLKELINFGYCQCIEQRREDGTFEGCLYVVSDKPLTENPYADNPQKNKDGKESKKESCIEKEINKDQKEKELPAMLVRVKKQKVADFVYMSPKEYDRLCERFGKDAADEMITILSNAKGAKGYNYKSDYHAILAWVAREYKDRHKDDVKSEGRSASSLFD